MTVLLENGFEQALCLRHRQFTDVEIDNLALRHRRRRFQGGPVHAGEFFEAIGGFLNPPASPMAGAQFKEEVACRGRGITYQKLSDDLDLGLNMSMTQERKALSHILGEIARFEHSQHRPLLPVIVVNKAGVHEGKPGRGFLAAAESCGALSDEMDDQQFIIDQSKQVWDYWAEWLHNGHH